MQTPSNLRNQIVKSGKSFIIDAEDERSEEYAHFYFLSNYEGKDVVVDAALYTLRMYHEGELFEEAEGQAFEQFPKYKKLREADAEIDEAMEEEVGMFLAEVITDLEEEEQIKVQEHVEVDSLEEGTIGLDAGFHIDEVTDAVIEKFVSDFNNDTITLDPTLYSFQTGSMEDDD